MTQIKFRQQLDQPNYKNANQNANHKPQTFKGIGDGVTAALQLCDKYPMVGVSVVDITSTAAPRTAYDLKTAGAPAAAETFRKETSGLVMNCLLPSFIVLGAAKALNGSFFKKDLKGVNMSNSWADEHTLNRLSTFYKNADPSNKVGNYVKDNIASLKAWDKDGWIHLNDVVPKESIEKATGYLAEAINNPKYSGKKTTELIKNAYAEIVKHSKAEATIGYEEIAENGSKIIKRFDSNLADLLRDQVSVGRQLVKNGVAENLETFVKKSTKFINTKSMVGLAILMPLAMSMQTINRAITRKQYGIKGAPIYEDFGKEGQKDRELTPEQKRKLTLHKGLAMASMFGLAWASMNFKIPTKQMFQFKGLFPTLDQTRWIATGTIASRFAANEDGNELRESMIKDMSCFAGLYFLGDYVAKATATAIEKVSKGKISLINRLTPDDKTAFVGKRLWNWVKEYKLKSFDEVLPQAKNWRSLCQVANIGFAFAVLGVAIPAIGRHFTRKHEEEKKALASATPANTVSIEHNTNKKMPTAFNGIASQLA